MPVTKVAVPYNESNNEIRHGWEKEISTILDAGADVQFVDDLDSTIERNIGMLGLFNSAATSGAVKSRGKGMTDAQATTKTLVPDGYHDEAISYIYSSGTATGLSIHVRLG